MGETSMRAGLRRVTLVTAAMLGLGVAALGGARLAVAQPAPPAAATVDPAAPPPPPMEGMRGPGMGGGHHPWDHGAGGYGMQGDREMRMAGAPRWMHGRHPFGLIYTAPDRKLAPADVQAIVQGFLLWHGNHSWKVGNVQMQGDQVAFSLTTADGSVIASFTMDPHDGRVRRTS